MPVTPRVRFATHEPDAVSAGMREWLERAALLTDDEADVLWLDAGRPLEAGMARPDRLPILLTRGATVLPSLIGLETVRPAVDDRPWRDDEDDLFFFDFTETPHLRGHAAYRDHPLFAGLHGGAYTWWPRENERRFALSWIAPQWPRAGRVVAVERAYIHVNAARATIWEYDDPRILCIGAYLPFDSPDPIVRPILERLVLDALRLLSAPTAARTLHWRPPTAPRSAAPGRLHAPPTPPHADTSLALTESPLQSSGAEPEAPFTIAGRRAFAAGTGREGLHELWAHPLRVLAGLRIDGCALERWAVAPHMVERTLRVEPDSTLVERIFVPGDLPAAILEWESDRPVDLDVRWSCDLRLMWPYDAGAQGSLRWQASDDRLVIENDDGECVVFAVTGAAPTWTVEADGTDTAPRVACGFRTALPRDQRVRLLVAASPLGGGDVADVLARLREPTVLARSRVATLRRLQRDRLTLDAPDPVAGRAVEWAKARLDACLVDTPGVGRSLIAGYWTSRPGWNDGRPGYAWYFGRDAVWTALASLAAGDFDASRDTLRFLAAKQDPRGKILHECTTSGSVHYDAADATPLYLLLAARHLAWTGDVPFLLEQWPHVRRALDFCLSTADDTGLIQNTRVGHGWIEFGRLGGGRVTYYNAAIWVAALRDLAQAAASIGKQEDATTLTQRAAHVRQSLEDQFWSPDHNAYALRLPNQTPDPRHQTPDTVATATHAVPLLLGVSRADRAQGWLDEVATDTFTGAHGVRMCARTDAGYDPKSYHGGAVWPLYTGWASWAEYASARPESGFRHWWSNVELGWSHGPGMWPEVMHGEEARSIGVTPDQAWSTAMVIAPLVCGLLGVEPDATRHRIRIRPQPPSEWDRFDVRNLRVGDARIDLDYRREGTRHIFRLEPAGGGVPPNVVLEPALPGRFRSATIDGASASLVPRAFGARTLIPVQLSLDGERTLVVDMEEAWPTSGSSG